MDQILREHQIKLMQAVAKSDRRAFETLYRLTSPHLFAIALRMLHNPSWAEEVLHDCFLTVWNSAADYDPARSSPMTWFTHIIRNRCIDGLRSRQGRNTHREEEYNDQIHPIATDQSLENAESRQAQKLHKCLENLSSEQRQSVVLAYYQGMSHSDIALWLQQPQGTVKSWIRRALAHLKDCVGI